MPVIGWLHTLSADRSAPVISSFREGLREAGYIEGENVAIEYRWAEGYYDRLSTRATELVGRKVDVILTGGGSPAALAAKNATSTGHQHEDGEGHGPDGAAILARPCRRAH